jgi:hypothetical protein
MNWFEEVFGFPERDWAGMRERFEVRGDVLRARSSGREWRAGTLETPSLGELRARAVAGRGTLRVGNWSGDAYRLHAEPEARGALVQVASQFNLLEMSHFYVSPEDGITRYASDHTQGPACALAAAPATLYRNYFVPVAGETGQTRERQLNMLADLAAAIPGGERIRMRNGYALLDAETLDTINAALRDANEAELDRWRARLRIGVQWNVEVTASGPARGQHLSQAFCATLPVSYNHHGSSATWAPFATLILEAAYEATLLAAVENAARGGSARVYLTLLGGGVFGNSREWILHAIRRALKLLRERPLDVCIVSHGAILADLHALAAEFN